MKAFNYGGYHFIPAGHFTEKNFDSISRLIRSTGIHAAWSRENFLKIADDDYDIYCCLENGRIYTPGDNELFEYTGAAEPEVTPAADDTVYYCLCSGSGYFEKFLDPNVSVEVYSALPGYIDREAGAMINGTRFPLMTCRNGFESMAPLDFLDQGMEISSELWDMLNPVWSHLEKAKLSAMYYIPDCELYLSVGERDDGVEYTLVNASGKLLGNGVYHGPCTDTIVQDIAREQFGFVPTDYIAVDPDKRAWCTKSIPEIRIVMKDGVVQGVYSTSDAKDVRVRIINTDKKPRSGRGFTKHGNVVIKEVKA